MAEEYKVSLVIYSGLPDPVWTVHRHHGKLQEIKSLLDRARSEGKTYRHKQMASHLGFRGFLVYHSGAAEDGDLIVGHETKALQELLLSTMPEGQIPATLYQKVSQAIESGAASSVVPVGSGSQQAAPTDTPVGITGSGDKIQHYAPELNLPRWNDYALVRLYNNCYNYANDKITNSFAQPGQASGHPIGYSITPETTLAAAMSDGLLKMDVAPSSPVPQAPQQPNCLVALVVAEGVDYHWYRLDNNGFWSHKPGQTKAINFDGDGNPITDPRTAANNPYGPDYQFVSFMQIYTNIIDGSKTPPPRHKRA